MLVMIVLHIILIKFRKRELYNNNIRNTIGGKS